MVCHALQASSVWRADDFGAVVTFAVACVVGGGVAIVIAVAVAVVAGSIVVAQMLI
jgi:hypothetical protein